MFLALASTSSPNPDAPTGFDNKSNGMADDTTVLHFLFPETDFCFSLYVHSGRFFGNLLHGATICPEPLGGESSTCVHRVTAPGHGRVP